MVLGIVLASLSSASYAVDAVSFELATGNKTQLARVGLQWDWANKWWQSNGTHLGGYWDLSLAQWHGNRYQNVPDSTQNILDVGVTPVFRYQRDGKTGLYAEAGIGAHYLSGLYDNNGRQLSTRFEFGDHIGLGYIFQNNLDIGVRIQHFSNGGIKHPNSGVNFAVMRASYRF